MSKSARILRSREEIEAKIATIVSNLSDWQQTKERVITDFAAGVVDGLMFALGSESILDMLTKDNLYDKKR